MHKAATIDQILNSAKRELEEHGINGLRIRSVSERAGLSPGTVTHYFPTVQHLLDAAIEAFQEEAWELLRHHPWFQGESSLRSVISDFYDLCVHNHELVRARFFLTAKQGNVSTTNWRQSLEPFLGRLERAYGPKARLTGHSIVLITMRYAFHTPEELMAVCRATTMEDARSMVIDHLCDLARSGPWGPDAPPPTEE